MQSVSVNRRAAQRGKLPNGSATAGHLLDNTYTQCESESSYCEPEKMEQKRVPLPSKSSGRAGDYQTPATDPSGGKRKLDLYLMRSLVLIEPRTTIAHVRRKARRKTNIRRLLRQIVINIWRASLCTRNNWSKQNF